MNEDYLWDRSGTVDAEIERLERTLAPLGLGAGAGSRRARRSGGGHWWRIAAAAAVVLAAAGVARYAAPRSEDTAWSVAGMNVRRGQVLRTGGSAVRLEADAVGRVEVAPGSEVLAKGGKRLELRRGGLQATIWAPAREFVVDTPSARAVDLGCQYTLQVDERGDGLLRVSIGWVAFEEGGKESFIPAGAQCRTRKGRGPGIPWAEGASAGFQEALAAWENGGPDALDGVLAQARTGDGLSLWHVLTRVGAGERGRVFDRLKAVAGLPPEISREAVVRGQAMALDACWDALGLENTGWWRGWERRWSE